MIAGEGDSRDEGCKTGRTGSEVEVLKRTSLNPLHAPIYVVSKQLSLSNPSTGSAHFSSPSRT